MIKRYTRPAMDKIWQDENKFQKMLEIEILACEAMSKLGQVPEKACCSIKKKAKFDIHRISKIEETTKHDVIAFLSNVSENVGPDARYLHMGLTSSDILDTSLACQLKETADILLDGLNKLLKALGKQARTHKFTVMVGRTHGIHAEPTTFGLKMALFYEETKRNMERLKRAKEIISYGKISGAVGTFANVDPFVEEYVCKKLGLKHASVSTQVLQRDRHAEYLTTLAIIAGTLEKLATEMRNLQRTEIQEVEEYFSQGQKGSSAMPHKKNPITCERVAGLSRVIRGNAMAALENIALWHERDITHSSVERIIFPDSTILLDYMLNNMINVIDNLLVHSNNMRKNLEKSIGLVFSQKVLLELIKKGMSREQAYSIVQRDAFNACSKGVSFKHIILKDKDALKYLTAREVENCFDLSYHLKNVNKIFKRIGL